MIRIILAEDHQIVRGGLKSLLEKEPGMIVTGEATSGAGVLDSLGANTEADVVLADMNMPGIGGIELIEKLKGKFPAVKVIILSALDHEKYVIKAFQAGAKGYLLKSVSPEELVFAIRHTYHNDLYICSELAARFLKRIISLPDPATQENILDIDFSDREIEILRLIGEGFTNQEIAVKLFTSKRTIENTRQNLIDKTGSRNTVALIRFAMLNGVI